MKRRAHIPNAKLLKRKIVKGQQAGWRPKDQKTGTLKHSKPVKPL
jgi:hypothetical protein